MKLFLYSNYYKYILFNIFSFILTAQLIPDPENPLYISPSYLSYIGNKNTYFTFNFFLPNNKDYNNNILTRGYGAIYNQYIGVKFILLNQNENFNYFFSKDNFNCSLKRKNDNVNIPLIPVISYDSNNDNYNFNKDYNIAFCKVNSPNFNLNILPGYNYSLTIKFNLDYSTKIPNIINFKVFTSTSNIAGSRIQDEGYFLNPLIIPQYNPIDNNFATLSISDTYYSFNINKNIDIEAFITFNEWFSWENFIICVRFPTRFFLYNKTIASLSITTGSSTTKNIPSGEFKSYELEEYEERKTIGFILNNESNNYKDEKLKMKINGLKTLNNMARFNEDGNYLEIFVRYKNSYVIYGYLKVKYEILNEFLKFSVINYDSLLNEQKNDIIEPFDVFQGGAFRINFTFNSTIDIKNKYFVFKQSNPSSTNHITFVSSSCDFSNFKNNNENENNFNTNLKCFPLKYQNSDNKESGIFFYYKNTILKNKNYTFSIWIFFDQCGETNTNYIYDDSKYISNVYFTLSIYDDLDKFNYGENRINKKFLFQNEIISLNNIICYNTYMGNKYYNFYKFDIEDYKNSETLKVDSISSSTKEKLFYREYFDWDLYSFNGLTSNELLNNLYTNSISPSYIYGKGSDNKISNGDNILIKGKITLPSSDNERIGYFFPMGMGLDSNENFSPIPSKFFVHLSSKFFERSNNKKCFISWTFGNTTSTTNYEWKPSLKTYIPQRYNWLINDEDFFEDNDKYIGIYESKIDSIGDNYLYSKINEKWVYNNDHLVSEGEWAFGDDLSFNQRVNNEKSPIEINFAFADSCHMFKNLDKNISSVYTSLEIIFGLIKDDIPDLKKRYLRVMRLIKLFPEGGVWNDNSKATGVFYNSNEFIIRNHFSFANKEIKDGVCLLEVKELILDNIKDKSNSIFIWMFLGNFLETEYNNNDVSYPIGNLNTDSKSYGLTCENINVNNFYKSINTNIKSDITSPIYNLAQSMTSIYQNGQSGYLFYLGSLLILYNEDISKSFYEDNSKPLLIPYYCPFYESNGNINPYVLGIFPSFIMSAGNFNNLNNFGNKGFDAFFSYKYNNNQENVLLLSELKTSISNNGNIEDFHFNSVKFFYDNNNYINAYNGYLDNSYDDYNDIFDAFILIFNNSINFGDKNEINVAIPNSWSSISIYDKIDNPFYVYGKQFYKGIFGTNKNNNVNIINSNPNSGDPYFSIKIGFFIDLNTLSCYDGFNNFCLDYNNMAFFSLSSNQDAIYYFSNYNPNYNGYLLDLPKLTKIPSSSLPTVSLLNSLAVTNDAAISILILFKNPFNYKIPINSILSFQIIDSNNDYLNSYCSLKNSDEKLLDNYCTYDTLTNTINCKFIESLDTYSIICYKINYENNPYTITNFIIRLPTENGIHSILNTYILYDTTTKITLSIDNIDKTLDDISIDVSYITEPCNLNSLTKSEIHINLNRYIHPGMEININSNQLNDFITGAYEVQCQLSFTKLSVFNVNENNIETENSLGNSLIYNCIVNKEDNNVIIYSNLNENVYKNSNLFSKEIYLYLWPVKAIDLNEIKANISIVVNNKNIINSGEKNFNLKTNLDKTYSSISKDLTYPQTSTSIGSSNIGELSSVSNKIFGDYSDYIFTFDLSATSSFIEKNNLNGIQLFLPNNIKIYNYNLIKCYYKINNNEEEILFVPCKFIDYNIINIFFKESINDFSINIDIIITSLINPLENEAKFFGINFLLKSSSSKIFSLVSGKGTISNTLFGNPTHSGGLRFYNVPSNNNIRDKSIYTFKVGFDYVNSFTNKNIILPIQSKFIIEFPNDYLLYNNTNPVCSINEYGSDDYSEPKISQKVTVKNCNIYGNKIIIIIGTQTPKNDINKFKYWEILINSIYNPINSNYYNDLYSYPFKINIVYEKEYYFTTGLNSNSFASEIIKSNLKENEKIFYRGVFFNQPNSNLYYLDILSNEGNLNLLNIQPGRFYKAYLKINSNIKKPYLNPISIKISFLNNNDNNINIMTDKDIYTISSLYGEPYPFYIGVNCSTPDGTYSIMPSVSTDNNELFYLVPKITLNVKLIKKSKIYFKVPENIPFVSKAKIFYYLSDINVDELNIKFTSSSSNSENTTIDEITIPSFTETDNENYISDVFSTITIKDSSGFSSQTFTSNYINNCYELDSSIITLKVTNSYTYSNINSEISLSDSVSIITSKEENSLNDNDIKLKFSPLYNPSFLICQLNCYYLPFDTNLIESDFSEYYKKYSLNSPFKKYGINYFSNTTIESFLLFKNLYRNYIYKLQCAYLSTAADSNPTYAYSIIEEIKTIDLENTQCVNYYFNEEISENIKYYYVNYCQYLFGINGGYVSNGCVICSDHSGKIIPNGYEFIINLYCLGTQCTYANNNNIINEIYNLDLNNNNNSNVFKFTVCATSERTCKTKSNLNNIFSKFISNTLTDSQVNNLFDTSNINYNTDYKITKYIENKKIDMNLLEINFIKQLNNKGYAKWITYYKHNSNIRINCYYLIQLKEKSVPNTEEILNCKENVLCGIFSGDNIGLTYEIPSNKSINLENEQSYDLYLMCTYQVPSPYFFTDVIKYNTFKVTSKIFYINIPFYNLFLFILFIL